MIKFTATSIAGMFQKAMDDKQQRMAQAATAAMKITAEAARDGVRANIAGAGFSQRWQNATQCDVYPSHGKPSVNPAAVVYNKVPYSSVFETGELILGKPLLWVPLPFVPPSLNTPAKFAMSTQWPLVSINRAGYPPMLGAQIRLSAGQQAASSLPVKLLGRKLRRGASGKRGTVQIVPVFVGIQQAQEKKLFDAINIIRREADKIGARYGENMKDEQ